MPHTLRDQVIAAQAARNEALRRLHRTIELYQHALKRITELETQLAALSLQLRDMKEPSTPRRSQWYVDGKPVKKEPRRREQHH